MIFLQRCLVSNPWTYACIDADMLIFKTEELHTISSLSLSLSIYIYIYIYIPVYLFVCL